MTIIHEIHGLHESALAGAPSVAHPAAHEPDACPLAEGSTEADGAAVPAPPPLFSFGAIAQLEPGASPEGPPAHQQQIARGEAMVAALRRREESRADGADAAATASQQSAVHEG
jgi:hypothetical protein